MPRPGVMLYFNAMPALNYLTYEQKGMLLEAILHYAQSGIEPACNDPLFGMAWSLIKGSIDRDGEEYEKKVAQKRYAVYCREAKKRGDDPIPLDSWAELDDDERSLIASSSSSDNK